VEDPWDSGYGKHIDAKRRRSGKSSGWQAFGRMDKSARDCLQSIVKISLKAAQGADQASRVARPTQIRVMSVTACG
jgi:hypothetical protein